MVDVPIIGWQCDARRQADYGCDPAHEMVISRTAGRDTCDGDSGGPVFERIDGGWRLLAITSRPVAFSAVRCGDGGVYVRVDSLRSWIDEQLSRPPEAPQ
jgi:secreted trypsin-like serine protease